MMPFKLKPLDQQVMVITGASSGIGLVTARRAAQAGARLVLAARNAETLERIAKELNRDTPGQAVAVAADVSKREAVRRIADTARAAFGGFDTWVNCAAVTIYGNMQQIDLEDHRRLFEINYWGCVHGSLIALEQFATRGGALINVGSVLSDRAIPYQGSYCASKHAVKGFTDALRMEIEESELPVSVTLIKPSAIDTPYTEHAKNYFDVKPKNPPPVYAPQTVARAILYAAEHPRRDIYVGFGGKALSTLGTHLPRLSDKIMERWMSWLQKTDEPVDPEARGRHSLYEPMEDGEERGGYPNHVSETSLYTQATLHPLATAVALLGTGLVLGAAWRSVSSPAKSDASPAPRPAPHQQQFH